MRTEIQIAAMNNGLTFRGLIVLTYLRDNFFLQKLQGINIRNRYPIFFSSSKEVRCAFEELISTGIVSGSYNRGVITELSFNEELMEEIFFNKEKVIKEKKKKIASIPEGKEEEVEIIKYYRSFEMLPKPAAVSNVNIAITSEQLKLYSKEEITEALEFASTSWISQKYYRDKPFANYEWVMGKIDRFMIGGEYRKEDRKNTEGIMDKINSFREESDDIIM